MRISVRNRYEAASAMLRITTPLEHHMIQNLPVDAKHQTRVFVGPDRYAQGFLA
jgi:hypothetical protein